jgi:two-component system KDP operon response regulator KdpE
LVLVVEDDGPMRRVLLLALRAQGYDALEAGDGTAAIEKVRTRAPQAMILDLGLPDMDGVEVVSAVRSASDIPIIVLSARSEEREQIRALDAGVNDYVTKPFREGELMARIRSALRHARGPRGERIAVGDLSVDVLARRVFVGADEVSLTPTEFKLLHVLARNAGRVVTHAQLLREVWGEEHVDEIQYLRVFMRQLREKLDVRGDALRRIVTAPGVGYRLIGS